MDIYKIIPNLKIVTLDFQKISKVVNFLEDPDYKLHTRTYGLTWITEHILLLFQSPIEMTGEILKQK